LDKFRSSIEYIEERIFDSVQRDLILEIQILKRNLINFETNLLPLQTIIEDLVLKHSQFLDSFGIEKMDDSMNKIKKMTSSINNFKEQAAMLTETNEAMIARSTNQTVKALTTLSIIFLIPSIIAGFFGMNVNFGWGLEEFNFWVLLGIILSILVSVFAAYLIFKKLKWI
jgi:Mg2+ and Co2+ transporter CorA